MQYTDQAGYDTLREYYPRLTAQLSDATNLGGKLFSSNLIDGYTKQAAMSHPVLSDKITALLEGVMRQGSRGAFQRFVEIILDDPTSAELGTILQGSYIKKNGVWTGSKPDVVNGQSPPVSATTQTFRANFARLQSAINPDDIIAPLHSKHIISPSDKDAASTITIPSMERTLLLLNAVERAIELDRSNFQKFLNILERIAKYKPLVVDIRNNITTPSFTMPFLPQSHNDIPSNDPSSPGEDSFCPPEANDAVTLSLFNLLRFPGKTRTFSVAALVGTAYSKMGVFLLKDETGAVVQALEHKYMRDAERINVEILIQWLQGKGAQPVAWSTLIGVLRKIELFVLADDIEDGIVLKATDLERHSTSVNIHPANPLDAKIIPQYTALVAGNLPHWEIVAQKVGMAQQDIEDIITNHRSDADRRCTFLRKWIDNKGNAATYRALHDVLTDLGELGAAERICNIAADAQHNGTIYAAIAQQQYEEAMKQGSVKMSVTKCLVLGIAGVGKTHLKRLILQEGNNETLPRVSTGLADNPVQAFVGSMDSILAEVDEKDYGKWEVMDEDKLLQVFISACQVKPSNQQQSGAPITSEPSATEQPSAGKAEVGTLDEHTDQAAKEVNERVFETFKHLPLRTDKKAFSVKLVQFIDSGGQPQFHELLPAFVQNVSAIIFCINLSEKLDNRPMIDFYGQDGKQVGKQYPSLYSHKQMLEQCVRAASARDVHHKVFVVGTHKDEEDKCEEKREIKEEMVTQIVKSKYLIATSWNENETIWAVNCKCPGSTDKNVVDKLRKAIISHCNNDFDLPIKWFVLEMQIMKSATNGVLKYDKCLQLAQTERLGMNEHGLKAALLHMVKYNLLLWYDVEGLRDVVFSDPQVILKIITDLVKFKYEIAGRDVPCNSGVINTWPSMFRYHATVDYEFLSQDRFKTHFVGGILTVQYFINLMLHLFIMVRLKDGKYLMPALLDPSSNETINKQVQVEPLLVCFPNECVPYGIFSCLVAFLQQEHCELAESNKNIPVCLHKDRVAFELTDFFAKFTIIDSRAYIEVHLLKVDEENTSKACTEIKKLLYNGIKKCAQVLNYNSLCLEDLKDGFFCSSESCKHTAIPYKKDLLKARCKKCKSVMKLTAKHTVWQEETQTYEASQLEERPAKYRRTEIQSARHNTWRQRGHPYRQRRCCQDRHVE